MEENKNVEQEKIVENNVEISQTQISTNQGEIKKKNNGVAFILVFIILVGGFVTWYFAFGGKDILAGKKEEPKPEENQKETKEENEMNSTIYGFAYVSKNNKEYKMMALNSKGNDIELNKGEGAITFYIKNNRLLFINRRANFDEPSYVQKTYYIDLNNRPYKAIQLTENVSIYDYFDFNSEYLFAHNSYADGKKGIKRYNFNTKEEKIFEEGVYANGIFIDNKKVYYSFMDYSGSTPQEYYYSIDFDGNNKEKVSKEEYDQVVSNSGYKEEIGSYNAVYFIKNGKKVHVDKEIKNLYLDEKIIYTVSNESRSIVLEYSEDSNIICFEEVTMNTGEQPPKYYYYHIDTEKLEEVNEEDMTNFRELIL